ncbi:MAG: hypothetical protein HGA76_10830, partial [Candidatus Firestonebacteria bacterium]|nr:hypothetical protein [Candidatus Firestonebacteria bacterium]
ARVCHHLGGDQAHGKRDPGRDWRQTPTEHFLLIYPQAIADVAAQAAFIAEQAYPRVKALFGYAPPGRTPVVLNPDADVANGYSTGLNTKMEFYLAAPTDKFDGTLNTSWLESLMYHEYAHLCHGLRGEGLTRVLMFFFGNVNVINFISPQWWNEGLAEYSETALTAGGRGRNPYHTMKLAANLLSDEPWSLGQLGTPSAYTFPSDRAYVGGYALVAQLRSDTGQDDFIDRAARRQSAWPLFGLGFVWRRALQVRVNDVFAAMQEKQRDEFQALFGSPRLLGPQAMAWTAEDNSQFEQPHWLSDGSLTAYVNRLDAGPAWVRLRPGRTSECAGTPALSTGRFSYDRQSQVRYYSRLVPDWIYSGTEISDLFCEGAQDEHRLTYGAHAWSPDISAEGRLVCVVNDFGPTHLALVDAGTGRLSAIPPVTGAVYLSPRWSPDGRRLAAAVRLNGRQDICLVDAATGVLTPLTGWDLPGDHDPAWSPDGETIYFVSDRTGVHQIFAYRLTTRELFQVTDAFLGAFDPDISPDGKTLALAEYQLGNLQQIVTLALDPSRWKPVPLPMPAAQPAPPAETQAPAVRGEPYSAWPHLLPTYWMPTLAEDREGVLVGALSARQDPLELHAWQAQILFQPQNGKTYGEFEYSNDQTPTTLSIELFSLPLYRWRASDDYVSQTRDWARREGISLKDTWTINWLLAENRRGLVQLNAGYDTYRLREADGRYFQDTAYAGVQAEILAGYARQARRDLFPVAGWLVQGHGRRAVPGHAFDGRLAWAGLDWFCPSLWAHQAFRFGARASARQGDFPDSFTETLPLGYHDDQRPYAAKVTGAYRFPLWHLDAGPDVLPLFIHALWGELEGDYGQACSTASTEAWKARARYSASLILHLDLEAFWYLPLRIDQIATLTQDGQFEIRYGLN